MWAGVQNVSRPTVLCQEMSQISPTAMLVAASASKNPGQAAGELATRSADIGEGTAWAEAEIPSIIGAVMSPVASGVQLKRTKPGRHGASLFVLASALRSGECGRLARCLWPPAKGFC